MRIYLLCLISLFHFACQSSREPSDDSIARGKTIEVKYAKGFSITADDTFITVKINKPFPGAKEPITHRFYRGSTVSDGISVPIKKVICTSTATKP